MDPFESKRRLRADLRATLAAIDGDEARRAAAAVAESAAALPEVKAAESLLVCLSFGFELDTWGLVERLCSEGRNVWVPRTVKGDPRLHLHAYPCPLETLSFGLRQPAADAPELPPSDVDVTLQAALVAGLAFDRGGMRLGYGAGYFDRFLAGRPFPAVGLCYEVQLLETLPSEAHDVPMDVVVTERRVLRPGVNRR